MVLDSKSCFKSLILETNTSSTCRRHDRVSLEYNAPLERLRPTAPRRRALLIGDRTNHPAGVAGCKHALGEVPRYDASRADHSPGADAYARANDSPAPDPHVRPDLDGLTILLLAAKLRVERMGGRVDLHRRAEQDVVPDVGLADVQYDAVEVEEALRPQMDVRAVIAVERRLHPHVLAAAAEEIPQEAPPLLLLTFAGRIEILTQAPRTASRLHQLRVVRVVQLAAQHFLSLGRHGAIAAPPAPSP